MRLKIKPTLSVMFLISITSLSACAGLVIKTWILNAELHQLERRDKDGKIVEALPLEKADKYRCYSRSDDEAWRASYAQLSACCDEKSAR